MEPHDTISELQLSGRSVKDTAQSISDVDLAIVLVPPPGGHNSAFVT
ncbi:hypothetical protein [Methylobacterium iners]|nr:hypothetical protein [Methylobacterium iners]